MFQAQDGCKDSKKDISSVFLRYFNKTPDLHFIESLNNHGSDYTINYNPLYWLYEIRNILPKYQIKENLVTYLKDIKHFMQK